MGSYLFIIPADSIEYHYESKWFLGPVLSDIILDQESVYSFEKPKMKYFAGL